MKWISSPFVYMMKAALGSPSLRVLFVRAGGLLPKPNLFSGFVKELFARRSFLFSLLWMGLSSSESSSKTETIGEGCDGVIGVCGNSLLDRELYDELLCDSSDDVLGRVRRTLSWA